MNISSNLWRNRESGERWEERWEKKWRKKKNKRRIPTSGARYRKAAVHEFKLLSVFETWASLSLNRLLAQKPALLLPAGNVRLVYQSFFFVANSCLQLQRIMLMHLMLSRAEGNCRRESRDNSFTLHSHLTMDKILILEQLWVFMWPDVVNHQLRTSKTLLWRDFTCKLRDEFTKSYCSLVLYTLSLSLLDPLHALFFYHTDFPFAHAVTYFLLPLSLPLSLPPLHFSDSSLSIKNGCLFSPLLHLADLFWSCAS